MIGSKPIKSYIFNDHTVAASANGTAVATALVTSVPITHARYMRVHSTTPRHLEFVFGAEAGTSAVGVLIPGQASATGAHVPPTEFALPMDAGLAIRARTVTNAPVTLSSTEFIHVSLWD